MAVFSYETADSLLVDTSTEGKNNTGGEDVKPENGGSTENQDGMNGKTTNFNIWDDEEDY